MRAVFRHEVSSYFTNVTGYVFGAFLLLFAGIYTMAYNLRSGYTNFEYVLGSMSFVFLVIVPILTMKVIAEEKRQKTDQLLYSLPLSMTRVVLGKYLALLVVFAVPDGHNLPLPHRARRLRQRLSARGVFGGVRLLPAGRGAYRHRHVHLLDNGEPGRRGGALLVVMLLNYFITSLASYASTTAASSAAGLHGAGARHRRRVPGS